MFKNIINKHKKRKILKQQKEDNNKLNLLMMRSILECLNYDTGKIHLSLQTANIGDLKIKLSEERYCYRPGYILNIYYKDLCKSNLIESFSINIQHTHNSSYKYNVSDIYQEIGEVNGYKLITEIYEGLKVRENFLTVTSIENAIKSNKSKVESIRNKYR